MNEFSRPKERLALASLCGVLGSVLLLTGVFVPISYRVSGKTFEYFRTDLGNLLALLAAISFVLTWVFQWYRCLWITALLGWMVALSAFLQFRETLGSRLKSAGFSNLLENLPWTWGFHVVGLALLLAAAAIAEVQHHQGGCLPEEADIHDHPPD
jgi:hypothetical protein